MRSIRSGSYDEIFSKVIAKTIKNGIRSNIKEINPNTALSIPSGISSNESISRVINPKDTANKAIKPIIASALIIINNILY